MPSNTVPRRILGGVDNKGVARRIPFVILAGVIAGFLFKFGIVQMVAPMQKAGGAVLVAHPHREERGGKGEVNDTVHSFSRGEAAGVEPHFLTEGNILFVFLPVFFKGGLLNDPHVKRAPDIGAFNGVVNADTGHGFAADCSHASVSFGILELRLVFHALVVFFCPIIFLYAFPRALEIQGKLTVTLKGGHVNIASPKQCYQRLVPYNETCRKTTHDCTEAHREGEVANVFRVRKVEIDHTPVIVADRLARGEHEIVVAHIQLILQIVAQNDVIFLAEGNNAVVACQFVIVDPRETILTLEMI